ncbi:uncharacterized protein BDZ99DRAFT_382428 [Mytilinidion resinicola]|uniref:Zn(2)-C6 fungal-type domain-containing protein n=1 Tax=Mytilinidion resinicola TaxID=574789 RepID=A0A6A6YVS3_9PEZI|nr:uncharacterized protein BDZ99DRAFT_382428 [Mytilinidion resinicola]KAF2813056.1 hypothetical protein BDZ99DRAFT_382428 [Mytilinidion resinicola]
MAGRERSPLPLSRTCQNCAHAKIKCHRNPASPICDRCDRLGKECTFRQAKRRIQGYRKDQSSNCTMLIGPCSRIEALEAKVNELLNTQSQSGGEQSQSPRSIPAQITEDVINSGLITIETANALLHTFKTYMTPHFPFVVIPTHMPAEELRLQKPFLFLVLLAASSYDDMPLQRLLGKEVNKYISARVIIGGEVSFELLQGLLVHLAWCQYHSRPRRYSQLLAIAISIIVDLRLDRTPQTLSSWKSAPGLVSEDSPNPRVLDSAKSSWGRDVQRAVAGCYYLSSSIAVMLQKLITFPYSTYIEDTCVSLKEKSEYATDKYLVYIIKLQRILGDISHQTSGHFNLIDPDAAVELHITKLRAELDNFRERLPFPMSENHLLGMLFHTVELYLYQISLLDKHCGPNATRSIPWSPWRQEILSAGLISAKSLLGFYITMPLGAEKLLNNTELIQIGFALTVSTKLSLVAGSSLVTQQSRSLGTVLDMSSVLRECIARLEALVTGRVDASGDMDVFGHYVKRVQRIQKWYEWHFAKPAAGPDQRGSERVDSNFQHPNAQYSTQFSLMAQPIADGIFNTSTVVGPTVPDAILMDGMYDLQFANFYSDATFDEMMGGWMPDTIGGTY